MSRSVFGRLGSFVFAAEAEGINAPEASNSNTVNLDKVWVQHRSLLGRGPGFDSYALTPDAPPLVLVCCPGSERQQDGSSQAGDLLPQRDGVQLVAAQPLHSLQAGAVSADSGRVGGGAGGGAATLHQ